MISLPGMEKVISDFWILENTLTLEQYLISKQGHNLTKSAHVHILYHMRSYFCF
jgi:hypothetical protein